MNKKIAKYIANPILKQFNSLVVLEIEGCKWWCLCDCGNVKAIRRDTIINGTIKSCGCGIQKNKIPKSIKHGLYRVYSNYVQNAKHRGKVFNLTIKQVHDLTSRNCHYCGRNPEQISIHPRILKQQYTVSIPYVYNGIDRVNNSCGYELDNCVPCCKWCNDMKGTMNKDVFLDVVEKIYEQNRTKKITT